MVVLRPTRENIDGQLDSHFENINKALLPLKFVGLPLLPLLFHLTPHSQNIHTLKTSTKEKVMNTCHNTMTATPPFLRHHSTTMAKQSSSQANRTWQDGEIAFLKSSKYFSPKDYRELITSGHLHPKATSHPVIILEAGHGRAIVTTVTAFSSGPENNFFPPWRMSAHREKHLDDFYAFIGTELPPNSPNTHLKLSDSGAKMNKPRASWVYIEQFFTVPYTVLLQWNKVPQQLRVSEESLAQIRTDIERKYSFQLRRARSKLTACVIGAKPTQPQGPPQARQAPQRPRAPRRCHAPLQHQHPVFPMAGTPAGPTRHPTWGPQHPAYARDAAQHHLTNDSCYHTVSTTGASFHPAMMHSWRQPLKT